MTRTYAPRTLLRRLPAYAVNGISVAAGIGVVHLVFGGLVGAVAAQLAGSAAVCASLADLPSTISRTWQRVLGGAVLATCAAALVAVLIGHPIALGFGIMAVTFIAMMTMAWGLRAGPVSFAPILALVFFMAIPPGTVAPFELVGWSIAGGLAYLLWSAATAALLQRQYRRLALVATLRAVANLLRSRSGVLQAGRDRGHDQATLSLWIAGEAALADRLQLARDLVFAAPDSAEARCQAAMLLRAIDLRDVLLASRLDLDLLGSDAVSKLVLERVAACLRSIANVLDVYADALRDGTPLGPAIAIEPDPRVLLSDAVVPAGDPRTRALPAIAGRLQHLADNVSAIHALVLGREEKLPLTRDQLQRFVGPETWPLKALGRELSLGSPVFRHAIRMSCALSSAYFIAHLLPWASHPHWLVLSVAVVLRGNLEQTLMRRNARVMGTVAGCLFVMLIAHSRLPAFVEPIFLVSVGLAHAFVNVRYLVTAIAATVMALLQSHLADPTVGFAITERLADTLLGAALGWAFSYVLPSWERHSIPASIVRARTALAAYANRVLTVEPGDPVEQRLARRSAYDALGAVAAAAQRSAVEPKRARLPLAEMSTFLDHAQRLMAHLSSVRLTLARGAAALRAPQAVAALAEARAELSVCLAPIPSPDGSTEPLAARSALPPMDSLPEDPPATDPLPWLLRRLQLSADDARRVRAAATAALAGLARSG